MDRSVKGNVALGEFLRSRRARLMPEEAGLPAGGRRRVKGLRRGELAALANISVPYYTRLEQGQHKYVSPGILDAIAAALHLSDAERNYLHRLAGPQAGAVPFMDQVRPETARLLRALDPTPAVLVCPGMNVLAANAGFGRLFTGFDALTNRNVVHWMLSEPRARDLCGGGWAKSAADMIGMLRLRNGSGPGNARAREVINDLAATHSFFREVWQARAVSTGVQGPRGFVHPEAGRIMMSVENLQVIHASGQLLVAFVPEPGSLDERVWHSVMARPVPTGL